MLGNTCAHQIISTADREPLAGLQNPQTPLRESRQRCAPLPAAMLSHGFDHHSTT